MSSTNGSTRPSWNEFYLGVALAASARGDCLRRKVGAVLVKEYAFSTATSIGYNGSYPGGPSCLAGECPRCLDTSIPSGQQYENCIEQHAEANAILNAQFIPEGGTMYVTCVPCLDCRELMVYEGIWRVVWPGGGYSA